MKALKRFAAGLVVVVALAVGVAYAQQFIPYQSGIAPTISAAYDIGLLPLVWRDFFTGGHIVAGGGTAPVCAASCGSAATVAGQDTGMLVTTSASGLTNPIVVTFSRPYVTVAPACTAANQTTAANYVTKVLTSTTQVTVSFAAGPTAADKVAIVCVGAGG